MLRSKTGVLILVPQGRPVLMAREWPPFSVLWDAQAAPPLPPCACLAQATRGCPRARPDAGKGSSTVIKANVLAHIRAEAQVLLGDLIQDGAGSEPRLDSAHSLLPTGHPDLPCRSMEPVTSDLDQSSFELSGLLSSLPQNCFISQPLSQANETVESKS